MAFESLLNKPMDEIALLLKVAEEVHSNYAQHSDQNYFLHLKKIDEKTSAIEKIKLFRSGDCPWLYIYIDNHNHAGILFSYHPGHIMLLINGEHVFSEIKVTADRVSPISEPSSSLLPGSRKSDMTAWEVMEAFADISGLLQEFKRDGTA